MTNEQMYKTPEERIEAFQKFCTSNKCDECECTKQRKMGLSLCEFGWLTLEAEEELLACPFCGGEAEVVSAMYGHRLDGARVRCTRCWVITPVCKDESEAIAAWNRRAK